MVNKMKNLITAASLILFSLSAHAAPIAGYSDVTDNGGGSYTFTFDTLPGPDIVNTDGLLFSGFGLGLTVTGSGDVIQDVPAHGGLGVNGGANGDNMGLGESLNFSFNQSVDLIMISFNGGLDPNNGHSDTASTGLVDILGNGIGAGSTNLHMIASGFDGVGSESPITDLSAGVSSIYGLTGMTDLSVASSNYSPSNNFPWNGYVESITVQRNVPEPSVIALLSLGLIGIGAASKRRKH